MTPSKLNSPDGLGNRSYLRGAIELLQQGNHKRLRSGIREGGVNTRAPASSRPAGGTFWWVEDGRELFREDHSFAALDYLWPRRMRGRVRCAIGT